MGDDSEVSAGALMRGAPGADVVREALVLATLERDLFGRRSPAPVLDRYVLLEKIGAGGLGVVFKAYDPDLDRQVALKLLRVREDAVVPEASVLLDEARMMAKVAHPNVLTIHDVGTYTRRDLGIVAESQDHLGIPMPGVFLVTEFMERGSLRDVLKRSPPFADVMPMLLAAGRGVAAAHARGIVHRDFKPGNVLIGADGGVCVGDFGLALPVAKFEATGDPAGTPAYMAPEQLRGDVADARSDQYAFALTCYQAVYGCQPFPAGGSSSGLRRSPEPGASRKIPRRIHAVLRRALQDDPAARYPDMPRLLRALESAMVHRGRRAFAVGGGVVVLAGFAALPWIDESQDDPCAQAGQAIDEVWNEDVRAQLAVSFRAPGAES
ncbi:MAG: serine/threonine-protein kinase, partial [Myxococcota bacterium]